MQQLETFPHQLNGQTRYTCHVAARPVQARYEAELDRVNAGHEDDRNGRGWRLGSECWDNAGSDDHA